MRSREADDRIAPATPAVVGTACALLAILAIYALRLDRAAGLMVDDAWYALLGKTLAEGGGYLTISSPQPILPNYPPAYPVVLSLLFRLSPDFPNNVPLLKTISIAAMLGTGVVTYLYLRRDRRLAQDLSALAAAAVTLTPAFVFLATSTLMTECVFTFAQLLTLFLVHRSVEQRDARTAHAFTAVAAAGAATAVMIRTAGVGLAAAVALWFLLERRWKHLALFGAAFVLCLAPWLSYALPRMPSQAERTAHGGSIAYTYTEQVRMKWAGVPALGNATLADLPERLKTNLIDVFGRDIAGIVAPVVYRGASESGEEVVSLGGAAGLSSGSMGSARITIAISLLLSGIVLLGFVRAVRERVTPAELLMPVSLGITLLWPFWSFRFVLPLAPYIFLYLLLGLQAIAGGLARLASAQALTRLPRMALLCIVGLNLYDHAGYVFLSHDRPESADWLSYSREVDATVEWMNSSLAHDGLVASSNSALVYLRTGRQAVLMDDPTSRWDSLRRRGVRYVVCLIPLVLPSDPKGEYKVLYQSPLKQLWVIEI